MSDGRIELVGSGRVIGGWEGMENGGTIEV